MSRDDQSFPIVSRILEEVSVDVSGPYPPDRCGNRWFVLFVDRKSRFSIDPLSDLCVVRMTPCLISCPSVKLLLVSILIYISVDDLDYLSKSPSVAVQVTMCQG